MTELEQRELKWIREHSFNLIERYGEPASMKIVSFMPLHYNDQQALQRLRLDKSSGLFKSYFKELDK